MFFSISPPCRRGDFFKSVLVCAPGVDGTIVHIEHHVDSITVYVCSDDDSCYDTPYNVKDLLHLVPPAHDNWGALLDFT